MTKGTSHKLKALEAGKSGSIRPKKLKSGRTTYSVWYSGMYLGRAADEAEAKQWIEREMANDPWREKGER